jgi:hypothetical protein
MLFISSELRFSSSNPPRLVGFLFLAPALTGSFLIAVINRPVTLLAIDNTSLTMPVKAQEELCVTLVCVLVVGTFPVDGQPVIAVLLYLPGVAGVARQGAYWFASQDPG